jgi:hypothetical protein
VTFALVALLLSACGGTGIEARDWAAEAEEQLLADGVRPQIVSCVLNVGRRELDRGPLSDAAADELLRNCRAADRVIDGADTIDEPDPELAMTDAPWTFGDDPELDLLWVDCEAGIGSACDLLFERSPVGSEYEDFGVGCGNRPELLRCAELDVQGETDS